ncbi:Uncharacterized protein Fot_15418 [Forsythia ovata]|uniref:Uncharacterized protein n=1 Tax=Forsythia ovata TaxID=205694 RepID=A0ABD1WCR0_9LAMI
MMEDEIEEYVHQMGPHKDRKMEKDIEMNVDHIEATETQDLMIEIATAEKHVRPEEQNQVLGNPDLINVQPRAEQHSMVIEIEPHERENRINEERIEPLWQGKLHVQMEETRKNMDQMEATELGELIGEEKLATGEHIQLKKDRVDGTEEQDHSKGIQHEVNEQSKTFQTTEANDMEPLEQKTELTFEQEAEVAEQDHLKGSIEITEKENVE